LSTSPWRICFPSGDSGWNVDAFDADFFHQLFDIAELHDHADGAGQGARVGDDLVARRGDIIAAGGRHAAERRDERFLFL
jgi:hypothetical protein